MDPNDQDREDASSVALNLFLQKYLRDQELGRARSLASYLALFPGHEDRIAEKYHQLQVDQETVTQAPSFLGSLPDPEQIGPYRIVRRLGEGGMGIVYLATQKEPVRRQVALKVIKPGMDSRIILARFESERQALALMNHPNIARVYDAGATDRGHPYFVMEHVDGIRLTAYCDRKRLSTTERLRLFVEICRGVQHAHQKGVIHRDLKPSNILVTRMDGKPVPKIIDFGLAKATGVSLTEKSLYTEQGVLLGTPAYMSPEQADPSGVDVDTRTDVYSLGVILYELLSGELPFDFTTAGRHAAYVEIRRIICEDPPVKPSSKVSSGGEHLGDIAHARNTDATGLLRKLKGDLDWITIKAMEKNRTRRYETPTAMIADIERHLDSEPIAASPPSLSYRLSKFVSRHRGFVSAASFLFIVLAASSVISTSLYFKADAAMQEAEAATGEAQKREQESEDARGREALARGEAEDALELAAARSRQLEEQSRILEKKKEQLLGLSDYRRLAELIGEADRLWPAYPDRIEPIEDWLVRARRLMERTPRHRSDLDDLRQPARREGEGPDSRWVFPTEEEQWHHDKLTELVGALDEFQVEDPWKGVVASVRKRLEDASTIRKRSIEDHQEAWTEAIASLADPNRAPAYDGLEIGPQMGLVPLGKDAESGLWEFAHLASGELPRRNEQGDIVPTEEMGLVLVLLPGASYRMGAMPAGRRVKKGRPGWDPYAASDEAPIRTKRVAPYFLSKFEMTQGQWERLSRRTPSHYGRAIFARGDNREQRPYTTLLPVDSISWFDCQTYLSRYGLTLPTEVEWEYGARGGTTTIWYTGNEISSLAGAGNLADAFAKKRGPQSWEYDESLDDGFFMTAPIGLFRPNPFGLFDVVGNVAEWCLDIGHTYDRTEGMETTRMTRGGAYVHHPISARAARRQSVEAETRFARLGVRPARRLDEEGR